MTNTENILFIYRKEAKVKVLELHSPNHSLLQEEGWEHVSTINPVQMIEHLCNDVPTEELEAVIKSITSK